ncbi:MAG TPA: adenylate cyclase regulatory domain-containing protein [Solirubrobacteraceae bacterium]|jgi:adenylate cyclase|nr:adenylate cyclase regulatory domain-containing protein [Solirubrobacteraceae bacterium]
MPKQRASKQSRARASNGSGSRGPNGAGGRASSQSRRGGELTLQAAAARAGVSPATLRRWTRQGLIPHYDGAWRPGAITHARIVARLRERGHSLADIRKATEEGRLAFGFVEELFPSLDDRVYTVRQAARETGLDTGLIERVIAALGMNTAQMETLSADDVQLLRYVAAVLSAGLPLVAMLQLVRVYGQAMAQVADAEVRLFHLYVHEPLMRSGATGMEMADEMLALTRELLPLASPVMDQVHQRYLQHFVEQDVVGHMESDLDGEAVDLGRMRVAIAFADLAGYTRLTEEEGELEAVDTVERFVEAVETTLPDDARVIKSIGDAVMIVGSDPGALTDWAVGFQQLYLERVRPRIGIHYGDALYRDGDYYGRDVNIASRVGARAAGGEVLVTRSVVERGGPHLEFNRIAEVRLKGFTESTEIFVASQKREE